MRFRTTAAFDADFSRLGREHRAMFIDVVPAFSAACDAYAVDPATVWPKRLRVTRMTGVPGVWEMTWSFASPDGRATFEFERRGDQITLVWRRIGDHGIYKKP